MRLIFKGKILKDDITLKDYNITDGLTIHLVKGGGAKTAPKPAPTAPAAATSASVTGSEPAAAGT